MSENNTTSATMSIFDMIEMPNFNWETQKNRGDWSTRDVSQKNVFLAGAMNKPTCIDHGAMNCVTASKDIWRCLTCARACYAVAV